MDRKFITANAQNWSYVLHKRILEYVIEFNWQTTSIPVWTEQ